MSTVGMIGSFVARSTIAQPAGFDGMFNEVGIDEALGPELGTAIDEIEGLTSTLLCGIKKENTPEAGKTIKQKFAAIRKKIGQELEQKKDKKGIIKGALNDAVAIYKEVLRSLRSTKPSDWKDESMCYFRSTLHPEINELVARKATGSPKYLLSWKTTKGTINDRVKGDKCSLAKKNCRKEIINILKDIVAGINNKKVREELLSKLQ